MTGLTAALDANMNDLHMPAAAYTRSTWIVADDDDIPPLVAETIPFVPVDSEASPADSEASPVDSPAESPVESSPTKSTEASDSTEPIDAMETSDTTDAEPDYTWSDVPSESDGTSESDEEDSRIPPQPWEGIPTALVVLFFAYMFTLSIGIWTGRLLV
jgi:ABC-type uncharacterized transport system involved in gliding motility auxiliary subunit